MRLPDLDGDPLAIRNVWAVLGRIHATGHTPTLPVDRLSHNDSIVT